MRLQKLARTRATIMFDPRRSRPIHVTRFVALVFSAAGAALIAAPANAEDPPAAKQAPAAEKPVPAAEKQAPAAEKTAGPKLVISQDTWDFGEKWRGEPASGSVSFSNGGDAELEITKVKPSCGCTGVHATKMKLQPGESAELMINYDTNRPGDQVRKFVRIFTNEAENSEHRVNVVGKVRSLVDMKPRDRVLFGAISRDEAASQEITLRNLYDKPLDLKISDADIDGVKIEFKEIEPGKTWTLSATTVTPLAKDIVRGNIILKTGVDKAPTMKIPVYGRVQPSVSVTPPRLMIPAQGSAEVVRTLRVMTRDNAALHVTKVESSNPKIVAEVTPPPTQNIAARPGAMSTAALIRVTIPPDVELSAKGDTITIHTDDPKTPVVTTTLFRMPQRPAKS